MADKLMAEGSEQCGEVWEIAPNQVRVKNAEWLCGLQTLCCISAEKLGYKDTSLQPVLKKLQVIGPGGCRGKETDWDRGSRSVATLLVQFPSEFTGGALVVQREERASEIRYELGKENSMAAFRPHYVVYAAGSSCSMDEVTSGYCLMMEYYLCLSVDLPLSAVSRESEKLKQELAEAAKKLKGGPDEFDPNDNGSIENGDDDGIGVITFLISRTCTEERIQIQGCAALTIADRDRLQFLMDANVLLPAGKQLRFYFAKLQSDVKAGLNKSVAQVTWYSMSGAKVGESNAVTTSLNVLNPDNETLSQLWETGEMHMTERFAIMMWAASADVANRLELTGIAAAVPAILEQSCLSLKTLRRLLKENALGYYEFARDLQTSKQSVPLLALCQKLVAAIVNVDDATLVNAFLKKYFDQLTDTEKNGVLSLLSTLVLKFGWGAIGNSIIEALHHPKFPWIEL